MSDTAMLRIAKAIMQTGKYVNNKQLSKLYKKIFGTEPTYKQISSIKQNLWRRDMYETRHRKIDGIKCIRVMSIDGVKSAAKSQIPAGIDTGLYRPDKTQQLINSVLRG